MGCECGDVREKERCTTKDAKYSYRHNGHQRWNTTHDSHHRFPSQVNIPPAVRGVSSMIATATPTKVVASCYSSVTAAVTPAHAE